MNNGVRFPEIVVTIGEEDRQAILFPDIRVALELEERGIPPEVVEEFRREAGGGVTFNDFQEARKNREARERLRNRIYTSYADRIRVCQRWVTLRSPVSFLSRFLNASEEESTTGVS